jgi:hypothetical protein
VLEAVDSIHGHQDRDQEQAVVNRKLYFQVPKGKGGEFLVYLREYSNLY